MTPARARASLDGWHLVDAAFGFENTIDDDESPFDVRVLVPHLVLYDIIYIDELEVTIADM